MEYRIASRLLGEVKAMVMYMADRGFTIPAEILPCIHNLEPKLAKAVPADVEPVSSEELEELVTWHGQLSAVLAPASPRTIELMQQPVTGFFRFLGPIGLVKHLSITALLFLSLTILLALSDNVNSVTINEGIFKSSGLILLQNLLFLLACAGMGATFAALHQLFGYVNDSTYNPKFNATYWIKIMMGLISGLLMSELIPINQLSGGTDSHLHDLGKPLMALLGGFGSDLPYRILSRLLDVVEQLFGKNLTTPAPPKPTMTPATRASVANMTANDNSQNQGGGVEYSLADSSGQDGVQAPQPQSATVVKVTDSENAGRDISRQSS